MDVSQVRWVRSGTQEVDAVLAYAGRELARYVRKLVGIVWDVRGVDSIEGRSETVWLGICDQMPDPPEGALTPAPWDDGFAVWTGENGLYVAGRNARSVLFGIYACLERQGARFVRPGYDGEVIPRIDDLNLPTFPIVEESRYRHRGVCIEGAPSLPHA